MKLAVSSHEFEPMKTYSDSVYREYMTAVQGEICEEKIKFLQSERNNLDGIISSFGTIQEGYLSGEVDAETYRIKLDEYNAAVAKSPILMRVEAHAYYIEEMKSAGCDAWFVYDTGWNKLFFAGFDWVLYAAVMLLTAGIFADEHKGRTSSGKFSGILRTTQWQNKDSRLKIRGSNYAERAVVRCFSPDGHDFSARQLRFSTA